MSCFKRIKNALLGTSILSLSISSAPGFSFASFSKPNFKPVVLAAQAFHAPHIGILKTDFLVSNSVFTNESAQASNKTFVQFSNTSLTTPQLPSLGLQNQATRRKD